MEKLQREVLKQLRENLVELEATLPYNIRVGFFVLSEELGKPSDWLACFPHDYDGRKKKVACYSVDWESKRELKVV